jgi:hypothetical protein
MILSFVLINPGIFSTIKIGNNVYYLNIFITILQYTIINNKFYHYKNKLLLFFIYIWLHKKNLFIYIIIIFKVQMRLIEEHIYQVKESFMEHKFMNNFVLHINSKLLTGGKSYE